MKVRFISVSAAGCFYSLEQLSELKIFMVTEHYCYPQLYIKIAIGVCVASVVLVLVILIICNIMGIHGNTPLFFSLVTFLLIAMGCNHLSR